MSAEKKIIKNSLNSLKTQTQTQLNDCALINTQGTDAAKFVKSAAQLKAKEAKVRLLF